MAHLIASVRVLVLSKCLGFACCANFLLAPGQMSHFIGMSLLAEEINTRGHNCTMLVPATLLLTQPQHQCSSIIYPSREVGPQELREGLEMWDKLMVDGYGTYLALIYSYFIKPFDSSHFLMHVEEFARNLTSMNFDILVFDSIEPQMSVLAALLDVPYVVWSISVFDPVVEASLYNNPSPLSYVPVGYTSAELTDKQDFFQRALNLILYGFFSTCREFKLAVLDHYKRSYIPKMADRSFRQLLNSADLWIVNMDYILEYPRPIMPNVQYVGLIHPRTFQPLAEDVVTFINGSGEDGVILFSLGTGVLNFSESTLKQMIHALEKLPQRVIWKRETGLPNMGQNIKFMEFVPQFGILRHSKTRLFISHCGLKSAYEAIYTGVPLVCLPILGDQFTVADRMVYRGLGVKLPLMKVTTRTLFEAVNEVLNNASYKRQALKYLDLFKSEPKAPQERAVDWMEWVMKHRGHHLRSPSADMTFIGFYNIDVYLLFTSILMLQVYIIVKIFRRCAKWCREGRSSTPRKEENKLDWKAKLM